jgi:hypothetical protein
VKASLREQVEAMGELLEMNSLGVERLLDNAQWRPITQYDKKARPPVLLRGAAEHQWTVGYWGVLDAPWLYEDHRPAQLVREPKPYWRKAINWDKGLPLNFDPVSFADIDERAIDRLPQT